MGEIPHPTHLRKMQGFPDARRAAGHVHPTLDSSRRMQMRNEESVGSLVVEEGQALETLEPRAATRSRAGTEHVDVLVIGGGQAGLSVGYHLARRVCGLVRADPARRERPFDGAECTIWRAMEAGL